MAKDRNLSKSLSGKKKSGSKKSSGKKKIRHTHIEHGDDGSHVIRHQFDQGGSDDAPVPDAVHGVGDSDGLLAHMQDQFGGQLPPAGGATAAGGQAAPAPAPAGGGM